MTHTLENGLLTVALEGRIDSANAEAVEQEINDLRAAQEHTEIALDADKLEYISSAGLRVVLRLRKAEPTLKVVNVSAEVYEIFDMTGFTEMIPVSKAYRRLSVDGCEVIGTGANGIVYRLDRDTIIKVYRDPNCLPDIQRERELARKAFTLDIPTAIPYDVVRVGDTYGSVFELLNALTYAQILKADASRFDDIVRDSVTLLKRIHATKVEPEDMPDMKAVAVDWTKFLHDYLPAETAQKLTAMVEAVPYSDYMMHGDYHVKNVMVQNGESLLIDMDTLCHGDPIFELASMYNAYVGFTVINGTSTADFLGIQEELVEPFWHRSLELYLGTDDPKVTGLVEKKAATIGIARVMRRDIRRKALETPEGTARVERCKEMLIRFVDELDTLTI